MIYVGLAGWGDHESLYSTPNEKNKLPIYASHFPVVEVDTAFYAIQPEKNSEKWIRETPDSFQFIVKAYQGMTGHLQRNIPFESWELMFTQYKQSLQPYIRANKLAMVLFQFPPSFTCNQKSVRYLRWCRQQMENIPCVLEFRHQSWFAPSIREETLKFLKEENWIHSICDEPQAGSTSVPLVLQATTTDKTLIRMHGRNVHGWNNHGQDNWRDVRYLYRYNDEELSEWVRNLSELQKQTKDIYMIFNNNSGGDAADNAKRIIELLGIEYEDLAPRQLNLF